MMSGPVADSRARLNVVGVNHLDVERDSESLLALGYDLLAQDLVGAGHEIVPAQPVQGDALRAGGCPPEGKNCCESAGPRGNRAGVREFQKLASGDTSHGVASLVS